MRTQLRWECSRARRHLEKLRETNIEMHLRDTSCEKVKCSELALRRVKRLPSTTVLLNVQVLKPN